MVDFAQLSLPVSLLLFAASAIVVWQAGHRLTALTDAEPVERRNNPAPHPAGGALLLYTPRSNGA